MWMLRFNLALLAILALGLVLIASVTAGTPPTWLAPSLIVLVLAGGSWIRRYRLF